MTGRPKKLLRGPVSVPCEVCLIWSASFCRSAGSAGAGTWNSVVTVAGAAAVLDCMAAASLLLGVRLSSSSSIRLWEGGGFSAAGAALPTGLLLQLMLLMATSSGLSFRDEAKAPLKTDR